MPTEPVGPRPPGPTGPTGGSSLAGLARNRKVLIGGAAVIGVAGFALYRSHKTAAAGSSSAPAGTDPAASSTGYQGSVDTTGTDVATQLGQFGAAQQSALNEYQRELHDALYGIGQMPTPITQPTPAPPIPRYFVPAPRAIWVGIKRPAA